MIFLRTALGVLLVACLIALAGLGYRLWDVQRQLGARVRNLEQQLAAAQADIDAIRASYELLVGAPAAEGDVGTEQADVVRHARGKP
jgi:hypothetical protein